VGVCRITKTKKEKRFVLKFKSGNETHCKVQTKEDKQIVNDIFKALKTKRKTFQYKKLYIDLSCIESAGMKEFTIFE